MQKVLDLIPIITKKREGKEKYISNIKHPVSLKRREITVCPLQCPSLWSEGKMQEGTVLPVISGFVCFLHLLIKCLLQATCASETN